MKLCSVRLASRLRSASALGVFFVLAATGCGEHVFHEKVTATDIGIRDDLYAVTAVGEDNVWVAGYFGSIYRSRDGGESWTRLVTPTEKSIYAINFADENNGWAVGRRGFVIHTTDGGDSWTVQNTPRYPPRPLFGIQALDEKRAWIVGDWGTRFYTGDGGETWEDRSFLVDEKHPAYRYLTDEELARFERGDPVYDDVYLNDIYFLDEKHGWMAAEYGMLFYTRDGGQNWGRGKILGEVAFEPIPFEAGSPDVSRAQWDQLFDMAETLVEKPYLRVRLEGFMTPQELVEQEGDTMFADERAQSIIDLLEGEGVSQDRMRILNRTPFDTETVDMAAFSRTKLADEPKVAIKLLETPFLFDIKFRDPKNGIASGLGGVILVTDDGGETWRYLESGTELGVYSVGVGSGAAFAIGEKGLHIQSFDGGQSWKPYEPNFQDRYEFFGWMRDLSFPTETRGWVVGQAGAVFKSADGGVTWEKVELERRPADHAAAAGE